MKYIIEKMNKKHVKELCSWKYEGIYAVYNMPSYKEVKAKNYGLINPKNWDNYVCFVSDNKLIAHISLIKKDNNYVFIGIGLAPSNTGKGLGKEFLTTGLAIAKEKYKDALFTLQVRSWNERAIKCYESVGFKVTRKEITKDYDGNDTEFIYMELI